MQHNNQYRNYKARVGDCVAFYRSPGGKEARKTEPRWHGPADLVHIDGGTGLIMYQKRPLMVPLHLLKVWLPENATNQEGHEREEQESPIENSRGIEEVEIEKERQMMLH